MCSAHLGCLKKDRWSLSLRRLLCMHTALAVVSLLRLDPWDRGEEALLPPRFNEHPEFTALVWYGHAPSLVFLT